MCSVRRPQKPKHPGLKGKVTKPRTKATRALNGKLTSRNGVQCLTNQLKCGWATPQVLDVHICRQKASSSVSCSGSLIAKPENPISRVTRITLPPMS